MGVKHGHKILWARLNYVIRLLYFIFTKELKIENQGAIQMTEDIRAVTQWFQLQGTHYFLDIWTQVQKKGTIHESVRQLSLCACTDLSSSSRATYFTSKWHGVYDCLAGRGSAVELVNPSGLLWATLNEDMAGISVWSFDTIAVWYSALYDPGLAMAITLPPNQSLN